MTPYLFTWIFLRSLVMSHMMNTPAALNCKTVQSIPNYTLKGHVTRSINGKNFESCVTQCERDVKCFSINYSHATGVCQVNSRSKNTNPCDFTVGGEWDVYMDSVEHYQKHACSVGPCKNNGTCKVTSSCPGYVCYCGKFFTGSHCEDCKSLGVPLGMKTRYIPDNSITASSFEPAYPPYSARFGDRGWMALSNDSSNPYFQIKLEKEKYISKVRLNGLETTFRGINISSWIKELYFSYSLDGIRFKDYMQDDGTRTFTGLVDPVTKKTLIFDAPIKTRYIKVVPMDWNDRIAMRLELYGCELA